MEESSNWEATTELTSEDFSMLNDIINITKTNDVEEISKIYQPLNSNLCSPGPMESNEQTYLSSEKFPTREDLIINLRKVALTHGYVTSIKKSKKDRYVIIGCDRGGKYRGTSTPMDQRKRATASRLIDCPFEIWGKRKKDGFWEVVIKDITHNHEPSTDMSGHPSCRRFSDEEMLRIKEMTFSGIPPRQILSSLRLSNPSLQAVSRTVLNARAKISKEILANRTVLEALFEELSQEEVEDYVWALEKFKKILGDDRQPSAIVTDRELALMKALEVVFPRSGHLLCVWHIEKNVLSKCKDQVKEDWDSFLESWTNVIESPDESSYNEAWQLFELKYKEYTCALKYIRDTWLPFKDRFVNAWTGKYTHFGSRVTSRVEGAHATIKKYLHVSTGNFRDVKEKICLAIGNQYKEITTQLASEKIRFPHKFRDPFFKQLVHNVSVFALNELYKQYELARSDSLLGTCKGQFSKVMGLPCAHVMRNKNGFLHLNDIHPQWRIDMVTFTTSEGKLVDQGKEIEDLLSNFHSKYQQMPLIEKENSQKIIAQLVDYQIPFIDEPTIQPHKGRPLGSRKRKETSSTTRDPSEFEIVENGKKCSVCQAVGHNRRTCHKSSRSLVNA